MSPPTPLPRQPHWRAALLCTLLAALPAAADAARLVVRAWGTPAGGVWPQMQLRVNGAVVGTADVRSPAPADHAFTVASLPAGAKVDVVFTNDAWINGEDRNLFVAYLSDGATTVLPTLPGAVVDKGAGAKAFDGLDTVPGQSGIYWSGALRLTWPGPAVADRSAFARQAEAVRFLLQAGFGPTPAEARAFTTPAAWIAAQVAQPFTPYYVNHVNAMWAQGADHRPGGKEYTDAWVGERFWALAATAPDPLRQRVGFALHHVFMVSQADSSLWEHSRAFAHYLDTLNRHAFGNYRALLEDMALSPAMGIYLSHIRNRKEDPANGRLPDENFAREVMQLFSIGLVELNPDGTPQRDAQGRPVETYGNADVMALARVFTGWSWYVPDNQLTQNQFRWGNPDYSAAGDKGYDLRPMRAYPGQSSTAEVRLFQGKPHAVTIPAGTAPEAKLRFALDALANHPNVGPFIGRQLIQQLVTSNPSPAYVARVSAAWANNGRGVRGDLGAVVRAILLDAEAARAPAPKLREPVLRVAQAMRAFGARSASGRYAMAWEFDNLGQRIFRAPSVFGWFRPGYVPPGTAFAAAGLAAPEFQLVNESTTPAWVNTVEALFGWGLGWNGSAVDVTVPMATQTALVQAGNLEGLVQDLNLMLLAGRMSAALRQDVLDAVGSVSGSDAKSHEWRARVAAFVVMTAPEFLTSAETGAAP